VEVESESGCLLIQYKNTSEIILKCQCGEEFKVSFYNFKNKGKQQCNICRGYTDWDIVKIEKLFKQYGYKLVIVNEYKDMRQKFTIIDQEGYQYYVNLYQFNKSKNPRKFDKSNPYTTENIKLWCKLNNKPFELISDKYNGSDKKLKWKCLKEGCGEIFEQNWNNITTGYGCSYCSNYQVGILNCLATKNPQLAFEWHPTLNGDLTPWDIVFGSHKEVWWQCEKGHEWLATIKNRSKEKGTGCPYCAGLLPTKDNNLLIVNPLLCEEWNYKKNKKKPEEYLPNSGEYAYWKCKECNWEWEARIYSRNIGRGCPQCSKSMGEKKIRKWLDNNNILYETQKEFDSLIGINKGLLSYDFYLLQYNLLIEYQGEQHEKPVDFNGFGLKYAKKIFKQQLEHDKRKREYAQNNNINLFEIWYYDYDNIEKILNNKILRKEDNYDRINV
jgi:hypothetical protein